MSELSQKLEAISEGRYVFVEALGAGATARVDLVEDTTDGSRWAAKGYLLDRVPDWKTWELIERGAHVRRGLDNPGIPRQREVIRSEPPFATALWIIEEYIPGGSFRERVRGGQSFSPAEVARIVLSVWRTLDWLHLRRPPIIHRDVKPSNLMMRPDGGVVLIDFGAIAHAIRETTLGGSTVVGTYGYMPPEQFMGQVEPASDLYALGATLLFLLTGREPSAFSVRDMRLDVASVIEGFPRFGPVLEALLEPRVERRAASLRAARMHLEGVVRGAEPAPADDVQAALEALLDHAPRRRPVRPDAVPAPRAAAPVSAPVSTPPPARRAPGEVLRCPACQGVMRPVDMGDDGAVEVDVCLGCSGLWLDPGELDLLIGQGPVLGADPIEIRRQLQAIVPPLGPVVYRQCPRCETVMHRRNFARISGVIVDECRPHGIFLDAGELEAIRRFVALGGLSVAADARERREREEARRPPIFDSALPTGPVNAAIANPVVDEGGGGLLGAFLRWLKA